MRLATLTLCLGLLGCASEIPEVEIGTGVDRFESIEDGAALPMAMGAQGGFHLWLAVRARGVTLEGLEVSLVAAPVARTRPRQDLQLMPRMEPRDGWATAPGVPFVLSTAECFRDRDVRIELEVRDRDGVVLGDARTVRPTWPTPIGDCVP